MANEAVNERERLKWLESECQRAKRGLEESNRNLSVFAHTVAHELKEPLTIIIGYCTLLQESQLSPKEIALSHLKQVISGAKRLNATIESVLAISRLDGEISDAVEVSLDECVQLAVDALGPTIAGAEAKIEVGPLPQALGNRTLLTQLFRNLISNAIRFRRDKSPVIKVAVVANDGPLTLAITDNGVGINKIHHGAIFNYFNRVNSSTVEGHGLGLAICKRIVEYHRGRIWLESEEGLGATFFVELPAALPS